MVRCEVRPTPGTCSLCSVISGVFFRHGSRQHSQAGQGLSMTRCQVQRLGSGGCVSQWRWNHVVSLDLLLARSLIIRQTLHTLRVIEGRRVELRVSTMILVPESGPSSAP